MADAIAARVQGLLAECPAVTQRLTYGTAGFRADARLLDAVFVKMGVLAALRSMQTGLVRSVSAVRVRRVCALACAARRRKRPPFWGAARRGIALTPSRPPSPARRLWASW